MGKIFFEAKWQTGEKTFSVTNPYNGEPVDNFPETSPRQIEEALSYLEKNRKIVSKMPRHQRAKILFNAADLLLKRKEEVAKTITEESGKTILESMTEVARGSETLVFSGEATKELSGEVVPLDASEFGKNRFGFYTYEPLGGSVLAITPFNFPLNLAIHKIAPAFGAGNSIVFKPSSYTPKTGSLLVEILLSAGCPEEAIAFLTGGGNTVGMRLVKDKHIKAITFTGSLEAGKKISSESTMQKITLELGSNSTACIFEDADWENYLDRLVKGAYALAGQVCISVQRIYVHKSIYNEFVKKYIERVKKLRVGDPMDEQTDVGPMISENEAVKKENWLKEASASGAKVEPKILREKGILHPCVVVGGPEDMKVCTEEAFAPLVVIQPFKTEEELLYKVNKSKFGLQAGVFTRDLSRAFRIANEIEVGGVIINDIPSYRVDQMPYGGVKGSGIGREGPKFAIRELSEIKLFVFNFSPPLSKK